MPSYSQKQYWEERYSREPSAFDWYQGWSGLQSVLKKHLQPTMNILQVGCGTSRLAQEMVQQGRYEKIINIDYSEVCVNHMKKLHDGIRGLTYRVGDARSMPEFNDGEFDAVLDKGTFDALLCGEDAFVNSTAMLEECRRVLKPGGCMMIITYGTPDTRLLHLQDGVWENIEVYFLTKPDAAGQLDPHQEGVTLVRGPFKAEDEDAMGSLSAMDQVHFVYVIHKPAEGSQVNRKA